MTATVILRRSLAVGASLCVGWAVLLFITGGVDWSTASFAITSRDPFRPAVIAVLLMLGYGYLAPDAVAAVADRLQRRARVASAGVALAVVLVGLGWGTTVGSGSDSYGYLSQADLWKTGRLTIDQSGFAPWPYEDWTLAPLGYRPGLAPHTIVPTYPPGLPLMVAAADVVGGSRGRSLVVPLLGGLTVWLTFILGALVFDELVGLFACILMAASPPFLYQLMWPMSDVPATAAWSLALVLALGRRRVGRGRRQRPGDCDPAQPPVVGHRRRPDRAPAGHVRGQTARDALRRTMVFSLGVLPAVAGLAVLNASLYGTPWSSGYGAVAGIFDRHNVWPNAIAYAGLAARDAHRPSWFLAVPALVAGRFAIPGTLSEQPIVRAGLAAFAAAVVLSYLPYTRFDEWTYVRFLLPAVPVLLVAAVGFGRWTKALCGSACSIAGPGCRRHPGVRVGNHDRPVTWRVHHWRQRGARRNRRPRCRDDDAGGQRGVLDVSFRQRAVLAPPRRMTIRYDLLPEDALDEALDVLAARGLRSYLLLESWEIERVRQRFSGRSPAGRLDWEPARQWHFTSGMVRLSRGGEAGRRSIAARPLNSISRSGSLPWSVFSL